MAKYRKKPVVIEAVQWRGNNGGVAFGFCPDLVHMGPICQEYGYALEIKTLEGKMRVSIGDWIIKGVKGEFYPCKPDIFKLTYDELVEETD